MFKSASIFKIDCGGPVTVAMLQEGAEKFEFAGCGLTQEKSIGWVPPRGHANGPLVENVGGQYMMKVMIETRSVPASALNGSTE